MFHFILGYVLVLGPMSDLNERKKLIEGHMPPEILVHGLVTEEDVKKLFEMYVSIHLLFFYFSLTAEQHRSLTLLNSLFVARSDFMNTLMYVLFPFSVLVCFDGLTH